MNKNLKLTLSMIVKNEEEYLRDCLDSVKEIVDEIVIVDTGSSDKTLDIANNFGARIYNFDWIDDFSAARNFALSKSKGDWILYLDADERLTNNSNSEIRKLINKKELLGINCIVNSISEKGTNSQLMKYVRIFKNNRNIHFIGRAHEQIEPSLTFNKYKIIDSKIEIIHLGYSVSQSGLMKKAERNLNLMLLDYETNRSSYVAYQIANSFSVLKKEEDKVFFFKEALKDNYLHKELRSICYSELADYEMKIENVKQAKEYLENGLNENVNHVLLNLIGTQVYGKLREFSKAIELCENALKMNRLQEKKSFHFDSQFIRLDNKKILYQGLLLSLISNNKSKFNFFNNVLFSDNYDEACLFKKLLNSQTLVDFELEKLVNLINDDNLALFIKLLSNYNEKIKTYYLSIIYKHYEDNPKIIAFYGSNLISLNNLNKAQNIFELAIKKKIFDGSIVMYLSSIYVKTSQFDKLIALLETLDLETKNDAILSKNLDLLKNKLMPLLQNNFTN